MTDIVPVKTPRSIKFTQYLRPHGRAVEQYIAVDDELADMADRIIAHGFAFSMELLTTGQVALYIDALYPRPEVTVVTEICPNGPEVPIRIRKMISEFVVSKHFTIGKLNYE